MLRVPVTEELQRILRCSMGRRRIGGAPSDDSAHGAGQGRRDPAPRPAGAAAVGCHSGRERQLLDRAGELPAYVKPLEATARREVWFAAGGQVVVQHPVPGPQIMIQALFAEGDPGRDAHGRSPSGGRPWAVNPARCVSLVCKSPDTDAIYTGLGCDEYSLLWVVAELEPQLLVEAVETRRLGLCQCCTDIAERIDHRVNLGSVESIRDRRVL